MEESCLVQEVWKNTKIGLVIFREFHPPFYEFETADGRRFGLCSDYDKSPETFEKYMGRVLEQLNGPAADVGVN